MHSIASQPVEDLRLIDVLALGDGRLLETGERKPFQVKLEDRVLFSSYAGTEIKIDGEDLLLIREEEILAVIE